MGLFPLSGNLDFSISSGQLDLMLEIHAAGHEPLEALDHVALCFMCSQANLEFPLQAKFPLRSGAKVRRQHILNLYKHQFKFRFEPHN